ncbi:dimethylhistidine N-methyltransferase [Natronospira proteinivora]|uniref:Dimethylhistidine N-methyltransferase n=1 Tax=Natronospira proteinivora TaxID=1807133 RepID=A0ABT1GDV7_9GAMM|nr:L-histidine N(alpha)-methyltransferase [Natronospira proteinivora]MCP1728538.1 dimethylhistidine N-methyltransferase [Natronospira proteinivora]
MISKKKKDALQDQQPSAQTFLAEVIEGLSAPQKWISSMYFYDAEGSRLFDRICELSEYYPTRTELQIFNEHIDAIRDTLGESVLLIEPGSGSSLKTRTLLAALRNPAAYVPVEISKDHLLAAVQRLEAEFPHIPILPVCADFTSPFQIPKPEQPPQRSVIFFPGSTIGNFDPEDAVELLKTMRNKVDDNGGLLIGVDLRKDPMILEKAYNDHDGVTAQFNLNLLRRINRELDADFDLDAFSHRAVWNEAQSRIEMHLVSEREQTVTVGGQAFHFQAGEYILSESSYKFTFRGFEALAAQAGWTVKRCWTDNREWFSVQYLE